MANSAKAARLLALPVLFLTVSGVLAGLARLGVGWALPLAARWALWHGVLMASCLMGGVISLERAVAFKREAGFVSPAAALAAAALLLSDSAPDWAALLLCAAAVILIWVSVCLWRLQPHLHGALLVLAAGFWLLGNVLWRVTHNPSAGVTDWLLFLVLTVAAERLELSRYQPMTPGARRAFYLISLFLLFAGIVQVWAPSTAQQAVGAALLALAIWLMRNDVARRTWRMGGQTRYIAACLLSGYVWLGIAGGLGVAGAFDVGHPWHDAALHAIALGFVFSMIFGHALIILPALARLRVLYHPALYGVLGALHLTLAWRVTACLVGQWDCMAAAGQANALSLLAFVLSLAWRVRKMR